MARFNRPGGNNPTGKKWNRGGSMRRNKGLNIDFYCFEEYAEALDQMGVDLKPVFTDVMEQSGEGVAKDVLAAVQRPNLPAKGKYQGPNKQTEASIIMHPKVEWSGDYGEIGLGFDKTKPGAGGWLITGTPEMQPDYELQKIFARKKYASDLIKSINDYLGDVVRYNFSRFK